MAIVRPGGDRIVRTASVIDVGSALARKPLYDLGVPPAGGVELVAEGGQVSVLLE